MKKIYLLLFLLFTAHLSQAQSFNWAQRIGDSQSDKVTCMKTDGLGNIYIAGYFSDTIIIGTNNLVFPWIHNDYSKEAFVAKLDSNGVCLWARGAGAYFDDRILGMDVDSVGNCVVTGTYWEGAGFVFPPLIINPSGMGSGDQAFIVKLDPNGTPLWGNFVTSNGGDDQGQDVAIDKNGDIYVGGFFSGTSVYAGGPTVTATNPNFEMYYNECYFLAKLLSDGTFQWVKAFGHLPFDSTTSKYVERDIALCADNAGGVYVTGGYDTTRQFGTTMLTSSGGHDCFVIKYDTAGVFKWVNKAASDKDDWANGICSDKDGNIYITGEHRDSLIMDTVIVKNYDKRDVFVMKMDAETGTAIWGKRAGSDLGSERGNDIWADDKCNIYVCGDINEGAKFGDSLILPMNGLGVQSFVARITPQGKWKWVATGGATGDDDRGNAIAKGKGRQIYLGGFFRQSGNFGTTTLTSAGSADGYFARLYDSMHTTECPVLEVETPLTKTFFLSDPVPNPSAGEATVTYTLPADEKNATLVLYSITGQVMRTYQLSAHSSTIRLNETQLAAGMYMYQLRTSSGASDVKKMIVVH